VSMAIEAVDLGFQYHRPPVVALENVSFGVNEGTFTVVMGPNGSGKTTLLRLVMGLAEPTSGDVLLYGRSITDNPDLRTVIGYVPQHGTINDGLPVRNRDIVEMGIAAREQNRVSAGEIKKRALESLEMMGLGDLADRRYGTLSGGQQQRVLIARALAVRPRLLVLDEAFSAMDLAHQDSTGRFLRELVDNQGLTVLFVAHNLNTVVHYIDDILVISRTLIASGSPDAVLKEDVLREAYGVSVPIFICEEGHRHPLVDSAHG
jgi:ABC-type Mn2+/Zn2+ transport system ATPase subunit